MKKSRKNELLEVIDTFLETVKTEEMIELITSEIKKRGVNSIPCYAIGGFKNEQVKEVQFLRVGLKKASGLIHHGEDDKHVLCALAAVGPCIGDDVDDVIRLVTEFKTLPYTVQLKIFSTCLRKGFKYPIIGSTPNKLFSEKNTDFEHLKPIFNECYFADYDNCVYKIHFNGEFDQDSGRPIFTFEDKNKKTRYIHMPEEGLYRISYGGVLQWGFDYAFSLDKEKLKKLCIGGFTNDYTL